MISLRAQATLPDAPIRRSHLPSAGDYSSYRQCLRWDFAFTCAFCRLHESDLVEGGAEGSGLTWIEHRFLKSEVVSARDDYDNCYYSCRFCNTARGTAPVERGGVRLLDPCRDAWADHFAIVDGVLRARTGDPDAEYTGLTYDLDDPRKSGCRERRRAYLESARRTLGRGPELVVALLNRAAGAPPAEKETLLEAAEEIRRHQLHAQAVIARFSAVPQDARPCRCGLGDRDSALARMADQVEDYPPVG